MKIGVFECTGIMGQDFVHPNIQSTTVLCDIGMGEVSQHHAHTFEKFDLNFQFQYEIWFCLQRMVATSNTYVYLKNSIDNEDKTKSSFSQFFCSCCCCLQTTINSLRQFKINFYAYKLLSVMCVIMKLCTHM